MIDSILIYYPTGTAFFQVGKYVIKEDVQTNIEVKKITVWLGVVRVYLSNKEVMSFYGLPYMIQKG